ncbi:fimbrial protein [Pseudomonas sp. FP215]|jgi:type 1 fimbria pilin|uniref:fimbrial protein n=1 Tax=Pseudomonas sp. FP215 TaxID=2738126 RepID=UPI003520D5DF
MCVALVVLGATTQPVTATSSSTINVTVILTAEPCKVNNNNMIEVNFGNDVQTKLVDGSYKKMQVPYTVQCPAGSPGAMSIRIEGMGASFDSDVLTTSISNFGIALLADGARLPINSSKDFTYPNWPRIYAVPVKRSGATLNGGAFTAGGIMKVEYR